MTDYILRYPRRIGTTEERSLTTTNDRLSHFINNEQHTAPYIIVISTKNEEKSLTIVKDFSVVPPSK